MQTEPKQAAIGEILGGLDMLIYKKEEFNKKLELLNALLNPYLSWQDTTAQKEHEDLFGVTIKKGEVYFKRSCGQAYDDVIKMSRESMDKFLYSLFNGNFHLQKLAKTYRDARIEEERKQINKLKF